MSGSEWKGWPSKEDHDEVKEAYLKTYGMSLGAYMLNPVKLPETSFCGCCGTVAKRSPDDRGATSDYIRAYPLNDVVDVPQGLDHIVIRDKDMGDRVITWKDA